jgi:hypothetical protein
MQLMAMRGSAQVGPEQNSTQLQGAAKAVLLLKLVPQPV